MSARVTVNEPAGPFNRQSSITNRQCFCALSPFPAACIMTALPKPRARNRQIVEILKP